MQRHCESHRRLLDSLSSVQFMLKNTEGFASNTAPFAFLERWFEAHLTNDDKKFADFLAERAPRWLPWPPSRRPGARTPR